MNQFISSSKKIFFIRTLLFLSVFAVFSFGFVYSVSAQDATLGLSGDFSNTTNLSQLDLRIIIARIIQIVFGVLGTILLVIILYAGWLWMTSQGEEEKIAEAKSIIKNATIGLAIMLSAFSIASFIISILSDATGTRTGGGPSSRGPAAWEDFSGSGALGNIVGDHYPFRDQKDVARNTKIIVTFRELINISSIVDDVPNGADVRLGECRQQGSVFNWRTDCDKLKTSAVHIYRTNDPTKTPVEAAVVVSYEGEDDVKTFVFRPYDYLGSDSENMEYTVELTNSIKKKTGEDAMARIAGGKYVWNFETGTTLDFTPPHVSVTYPERGAQTERNYLLQVTFDEAMDPTAVQGRWALDTNFLNIVTQPTSSVFVTGTWKITNGYKTIEFVSDQSCGFNSCGDVMYCLAVDRTSGCAEGLCPVTPYQVLLRTAATISGTSFESIPFTGIMDVAGNALDAGEVNIRNGKPVSGGRVIGDGEAVPDNYIWNFGVLDAIDTTAPFVHRITPSIDEENVSERADLKIIFGRQMSYTSLGNLKVEEHGLDEIVIPEGESRPDSLWFVPRSSNVSVSGFGVATTTQTTFEHRVFGPNGLDLFYFTSIPSSVVALNQNCLYPGRGPAPIGLGSSGDGNGSVCTYSERSGVVGVDSGCVDVQKSDSNNDTGCGFGSIDDDTTVSSTQACIDLLKVDSL